MKPDLSRPPLKLSSVPASSVQMREGERRSIVCPECGEWHPLRRNVVWPHHLERTERGKNGRRCPGSARRVEIDVDLADWGREIAEADATVTGRRTSRVTRRPTQTPPPPVGRMSPAPVSAAAALASYRAHVRACATCTGRDRCPLGTRLARTADIAQGRARIDRRYAAAMAGQRAAAWTRQYEATADATQHAKRSGTAVEEANNQCKRPLSSAVSGYRGPALPLLND